MGRGGVELPQGHEVALCAVRIGEALQADGAAVEQGVGRELIFGETLGAGAEGVRGLEPVGLEAGAFGDLLLHPGQKERGLGAVEAVRLGASGLLQLRLQFAQGFLGGIFAGQQGLEALHRGIGGIFSGFGGSGLGGKRDAGS